MLRQGTYEGIAYAFRVRYQSERVDFVGGAGMVTLSDDHSRSTFLYPSTLSISEQIEARSTNY